MPVTPSSLNPCDRHTRHRLQHLVSLLHLQDHRLLFLRLHRLNFPRHFRRGKNLGHCAVSHAQRLYYSRMATWSRLTSRLFPQIFPFARRRAIHSVYTRYETTTLVVDLDNSFVDRNCGKEYEVRAARENRFTVKSPWSPSSHASSVSLGRAAFPRVPLPLRNSTLHEHIYRQRPFLCVYVYVR